MIGISKERVCEVINEGFKEFKPVIGTTIKFGKVLEYVNEHTDDRIIIEEKVVRFIINMGHEFKISELDYTVSTDMDLISFLSIMMTRMTTRLSTMGKKTNKK